MINRIVLSFFTIFSLTSYSLLAESGDLKIILNMWNESVYPNNFRQCPDLNASASAQYSEKSLKKMLEKLPSDQVMLVDLRQESHGFFGGMAVSWWTDHNWANLGKTNEEAEADELEKLSNAYQQSLVFVYHARKVPFPVYVRRILTERELATSLGVGYTRFAIPDHQKPTDRDVDAFIVLLKTLPEGTWLHFHCSAGIGRATVFLTMLDMMRNAESKSCQEIMDRQIALGGRNLLKTEKPDHWKFEHAYERSEFIQKFHNYCRENPSFEQPWSVWILQQTHLE